MTPDAFLSKFNVGCFWHFTDTQNLDSIRGTGGLLPLSDLGTQAIDIQAPGGNQLSHDLDRQHGLDQYVHLCLMNEHPMEYRARQDGRIVNSRFLAIDKRILHLEGIRFSPEVANKQGVQLLTLAEAVDQMDFEVVYRWLDWKDPAIQARRLVAKKYELLVPGSVPLSMIKGL